MTNKKNSNEVITKITMDILEQLNLDQFEHIEQRTKMSGELNPYFNKDAVYFLGGIVNQIAWSLTSKQKYLDEIENSTNLEIENNPTNPDTTKSDKVIKAEASFENGRFFFDMMVNIFNVYTGWTWNDGKSTQDHGQKWYAEYKESQNRKVLSNSTKDIKAQMKARLSK